MQSDILNDMMPISREYLLKMMRESCVNVKTNFKVKEITKDASDRVKIKKVN